MAWMATKLQVANVEKSLQYYQEALGFKVWFNEAPEVAGVTNGAGRIILDLRPAAWDQSKPVGVGAVIFCFMDEVQAYYETVARAANVIEPLERKPWGHLQFTVADPDGYHLTFAQEVSN